mmetsp:Transcript_97812/g.183926  ORF Transcript_97812/g.183926 Transcript_97812/m.183926 type:complete len:217 (-) Transcript_97812:6546-7196(-)
MLHVLVAAVAAQDKEQAHFLFLESLCSFQRRRMSGSASQDGAAVVVDVHHASLREQLPPRCVGDAMEATRHPEDATHSVVFEQGHADLTNSDVLSRAQAAGGDDGCCQVLVCGVEMQLLSRSSPHDLQVRVIGCQLRLPSGAGALYGPGAVIIIELHATFQWRWIIFHTKAVTQLHDVHPAKICLLFEDIVWLKLAFCFEFTPAAEDFERHTGRCS